MPSIMYFLRQPMILNNQIVLTIVWIITAFSFYLNNTFIKYVPGNFEDNYLAVSTTDIFVSLTAGYMYYNIPNPKVLFFAYSVVAALSMACMVLFVDHKHPNWTVPVYISLNRAGVIANFITLYMAHPTFFPTLFIATSLGISNLLARCAVILAPLFAEAASPVP